MSKGQNPRITLSTYRAVAPTENRSALCVVGEKSTDNAYFQFTARYFQPVMARRSTFIRAVLLSWPDDYPQTQREHRQDQMLQMIGRVFLRHYALFAMTTVTSTGFDSHDMTFPNGWCLVVAISHRFLWGPCLFAKVRGSYSCTTWNGCCIRQVTRRRVGTCEKMARAGK